MLNKLILSLILKVVSAWFLLEVKFVTYYLIVKVKILRLLRILGHNDAEASETMNDILAQVVFHLLIILYLQQLKKSMYIIIKKYIYLFLNFIFP